jgi:hypothetical protein
MMNTLVVFGLACQLMVHVILELLDFEVSFIALALHLLLQFEHLVGDPSEDEGLSLNPGVLLSLYQLEQLWVTPMQYYPTYP